MQNVKGTYDYFGAEQITRQRVQRTLEKWFERYDFDPMVTPMLNEQSLLASKYAGGDEILKEMYQLSDQGGRSLALRYDLTIPFAKVAALNPGLTLPFKRYEIGKVFRDGPVKRGRLREFLQCDADVIGTKGAEAEVQLMQLAADIFAELNIDIEMRWNNRRFLSELLVKVGVRDINVSSIMLTLDKAAKIGAAGVQEELAEKGLAPLVRQTIGSWLERGDLTFEELVRTNGLEESMGANEVKALQSMITATGLGVLCRFDPFLSRGLSFYTGTVYEIFDRTGQYTSSLGGGGRYDAIIGKLIGRDDIDYPAVGISFGMEPIMAILTDRGSIEASPPILLLPIGDTLSYALETAAALRQAGFRVRVDGSGRKLRKALASAAASGIRYVLLLGENEKSTGSATLKDLGAMTETQKTLAEVIASLGKDYL
ncbi:histidine--tRNA ligase [Paenibacillus sp. YIM B09110]|uniref:histidine--tRNA ligase n=1 Tax=Paenibacillus sp. YIM B09110 TaxID=3126102 RepID=UPI00301D14F1